MVTVCIGAIVGCSALLVASSASLIGDGSYYLLRAIQAGQPYVLGGRQWIGLVREGPLLVARAQGVTNTQTLAIFQGIGYVLLPAAVWILALVHARRSRMRFTLVTLSCGLCFASLILFSVSELALALPLVVLSSLLLTQPMPWSGANATLVILSTGLLFFSHEAIAPCAVLLLAMALFRTSARLGIADTIVAVVVVALSVAVLIGAIWTIVFWPNENAHSFLNFSQSIVLLVMAAGFLIGWAALYGRVPHAEWLRWALLVPAVGLTMLGIQVGIHDGPEGAYQSRSVSVVVLVALQAVLLIDWIRRRQTGEADFALSLSRSAARAGAAFLIGVLLVPTVGAVRWSIVLTDFRSTITHHSGVVPVADVRTTMAKDYLTSWTNTSLSVVVRSSGHNAVVANTGRINPFGVDSAEQQIPPEYRWGN